MAGNRQHLGVPNDVVRCGRMVGCGGDSNYADERYTPNGIEQRACSAGVSRRLGDEGRTPPEGPLRWRCAGGRRQVPLNVIRGSLFHAAQNERFVFKGSTPSRRSPRWSLRAKTRAAAMKYAWPDKNGHIARGGEVPMVAVAQAIEFANRHGLLGRNPRGHERTPDRLRARIHRRAKTSPPQRNGATRR
jgi:hypothetical protein